MSRTFDPYQVERAEEIEQILGIYLLTLSIHPKKNANFEDLAYGLLLVIHKGQLQVLSLVLTKAETLSIALTYDRQKN